MGRSSVRVIARTRPTDHFATNAIRILDDGKTFNVHNSSCRKGTDVVNNTAEDKAFKLDMILKDASQETIFDIAASDLVKSTIAGYNCSLMCYGQTGAGKTFTLMGGADYRTRGCIPRSIKLLFDEISSQADKAFEVRVSFVEVYNEQIRDLLDPNSTEDLAIQEDSKGTVTIRGAQQRECLKEAEALALLFEGNTNRQVAGHVLNAQSSRSHAVFTLHVHSRSRVESESASIVSKLHCIDLAGSERLSKTGSEGTLAKEAQFINKSLIFLEQVVMALGSANRSHVPFRQSKLTNLLKDSLGGNSKTTMIANIWPEETNIEETISTLKFATRMMKVQTDASINTVTDPATQIKQLQRNITELKAELHMQNQLVGKSHIVYEGEIGEDERYEMEKTVRAYVASQVPEIAVRSLREVREYFKIFKALTDLREAELKTQLTHSLSDGRAQSFVQPAGAAGKQGTGGTMGVGIIDRSTGVSVGVAAPSRNLREVMKAPAVNGSPGRQQSVAGGGGGTEVGDESEARDRQPDAPGKNIAFAEYKGTVGSRANKVVKDTTEQLAATKRQISELGFKVNDKKGEIDAMAITLDRIRDDRRIAGGDDDVVDDEEFTVVRDVKTKKNEYRKLHDELTGKKADRDNLTKLLDASRRQLVEDFEQWYGSTYGHGGYAARGTPGKPLLPSARGGGGGSSDDDLDEGEKFEALEMHRMMDDDPDSVAFYAAKKTLQVKQSAKKTTQFQRRK